MENNIIKVSVVVAGQRFTILTDKSEKYVRDIASEIDARINSLVVSSNMTRERAAVLTAMDYADDSVLDRENIAAVKEQIKDYVQEIERLQDNNAKLVSDYNLLKAEYERLIEERQTAQNFEENIKKALDDSQAQIASLQEQLKKANEQIDFLKNQQTTDDDIPLPEEVPEEQEKPITAEDDLFFDPEEEEVIVYDFTGKDMTTINDGEDNNANKFFTELNFFF